MSTPKSLNAKNIVVTGALGLLGNAIAVYCYNSGAHVTGLDITDHHAKKNPFEIIPCDVTNLNQVQDFIQNAKRPIDGWVNCAYPRTSDWSSQNHSADSWQKNMDMQLGSVCQTMELVGQAMSIQKSGSMVSLASIYGMLGPQFDIYEHTNMTMPAPYAAIKGGLINFSRYMAAKLGPAGIRVNCVSPGGIYDRQPDSFVKEYSKRTMLKRMGTPDDITACVAFLLSDQASYITGQNIAIDGGWSAM